jgi:hexokinase
MYLGEISRNVLLSLVDSAPSSLLFGGSSSKVLNTHYGVDTAVMSAIEEAWEAPPADANNQCEPEGDKTRTESTEGVHVGAEPIQPETSASGVTTTASAKTTTSAANAPPSAPPITRWFESGFDEKRDVDEAVRARLANVRGVLVKELALAEEEVTLRDAAVVHWVCRLVAGRAAKLSGCAVAAVAVQTGHARLGADANHSFDAKTGKVAVGVDGSLIQFYPNFEAHLRESLRALVGPEVEKATEIGMAKDGSGVGGAFMSVMWLVM